MMRAITKNTSGITLFKDLHGGDLFRRTDSDNFYIKLYSSDSKSPNAIEVVRGWPYHFGSNFRCFSMNGAFVEGYREEDDE